MKSREDMTPYERVMFDIISSGHPLVIMRKEQGQADNAFFYVATASEQNARLLHVSASDAVSFVAENREALVNLPNEDANYRLGRRRHQKGMVPLPPIEDADVYMLAF